MIDAYDPILFDLDGTLTESGPGIMASLRYALTRMGQPLPDDATLQRFIGPPLAESFRDVCRMDPAEAQFAIDTYREHYAEHGQFQCSAYDGIPQVLTALVEAGRTLAVATSKAQGFADSVLGHVGLRQFFTVVVGARLDGSRSRKADIVQAALHDLGMADPNGVLVGDRYHDVFGALSAGLPCIGVLWGYGSAQELSSAGAAALADSPEDLLPMLGL